MSSVDDRIVNMQFNNKQFTQGIAESQKSLNGLENSLAKTAKSQGLQGLGTQVDRVSGRFNAMKVAGIAAVATVASKATTMGIGLVKSLTLDPIMDGFREYELNLKSTQTIMANTGASAKVTGKYLNNLNHYSDQTIYNFSQMADSIGKFTAAGVKLPAATDAIKGMANTAALTGASSMQLNSAMYQVSQALASGTIKLMDWNSLVNANMGTKNMQKALMATNKTLGDHGAAMDAAIKKNGTFRDSLQTGWLTAETFTKTMKVMAGQTLKAGDLTGKTTEQLKKLGWEGKKAGDTVSFTVKQLQKMGYSKEAAKELHRLSSAAIESATKIKSFTQMIDVVKESVGSGFAKLWQDMFGNLKQAGDLWTGVGNRITGAVGRIFGGLDKMLLGWKKFGGYKAFWQGFGNIFKTLGNLIHPFVAAFQALSPASRTAGKGLANASKGFEAITGWIEKASRAANLLTPVLVGMITGIKTAFGFIGKAIGSIDLSGFAGPMADVLAIFKDLGVIASSGLTDLKNIIVKLAAPVINLLTPVKSMAKAFGSFGDSASKGASKISGPLSKVADFLHNIRTALDEVANSADPMGTAISKIGDALKGLGGKFSSIKMPDISLGGIKGLGSQAASAGADIIRGIVEGIKGASVDEIRGSIEDVANNIINFFKNALGIHSPAREMIPIGVNVVLGVAEGIANAAGAVSGAIGAVVQSIHDTFNTLFGDMSAADWAGVFNTLMTGGLILSIKKFTDTLDEAGSVFSNISGAFSQLKESIKSYTDGSIRVKTIQAIAIAIGVLTASLVALSFLDPKKMAIGLGGISAMLAQIVATMYAMSKIKNTGSSATMLAGAMAIVSAAVLTLAGAVGIFGNMDIDTLERGLGALATTLALVTGTMLGLGKAGPIVKGTAGSIFVISLAIASLAASVAAFGNMDLHTLEQGLGAVASTLALVVGTMVGLGKAGPLAEGSAGVIFVMATAINILALAVAAFGKMNPKTLAKGLGAVGISLALVAGAMIGLGKMGPMAEGAAGAILAVSVSLLAISKAVSTLGSLDPGTLAKGLVALGVGLGIMIAALMAMSSGSVGMLAAGAAMLAFGVAIKMLVSAISTLGSMDLGTIVKGLLALTALAIPIGIIGAVAMAVSPGLIALGASVALMGAGILGAGVGIYYFTKAILNFGTIIKSVFGAVMKPIKSFGSVFSGLLPVIKNSLMGTLKLIKGLLSPLVGWFGDLMSKLGGKIKSGIGAVLSPFKSMFSSIKDLFTSVIPTLASKGASMVTNIVKGIGQHIGEIGGKIKTGIGNALTAIKNKMSDFASEGASMAGHLLSGLAGGLKDAALGPLKAAAEHVADSLPGWMRKVLGINSPSKVTHEIGKWVSIGLANGVAEHARAAVDAVKNVTDQVLAKARQAVKDSLKLSDDARKAADKKDKKNKKKKKPHRPKPDPYYSFADRSIAASMLAKNAASADKAADKAEAKANKKGASAASKAAAKKARHHAKNLARASKIANTDVGKRGAALIDNATKSIYAINHKPTADQQKVIDQARAMGDLDTVSSASNTLGDEQTARAQSKAEAAQKTLAKSRKEAQQAADKDAAAAKARAKHNDAAAKAASAAAKKLRDQAAADAKNAQKIANDASMWYNRATNSYASSIAAQAEALKKQRDTYAADANWQAKYDAADSNTQASMLNDRAKEESARATALNAQADQLIAKAKSEAKKNAAQAQADLDAANKAAQDAQSASDAAKQDRDQAKQLVDQAQSSADQASLTPSKTAMEDAAKSVDRYSASLANAEYLAGAATPAPIQYNQYNYSPEALSTTQIYRQSKNLLTATEIKMGAN